MRLFFIVTNGSIYVPKLEGNILLKTL